MANDLTIFGIALPGMTGKKPAVFVKNPKIKIRALKKEYVAVLDKNGAVPVKYPILEFRITNGPPNHYYDVQVARRYSKLLSGGPGLTDAWDQTKKVKDRIWLRPFSSWSNGQRSLRLDANGKATYRMPLEWWRDLPRLPLDKFVTTTMYYRVLAFSNAFAGSFEATTNDASHGSAPSVKIRNNLTQFRVYKLRYHKDLNTAGRWRRFARIEFKVREDDTTSMYNMVQWKKGGRVWEDGTSVWGVKDYNIQHSSNYSTWQIDRVKTDPRYWDGAPYVKATDAKLNKKTAYYTDDVSCGPPYGGHTRVDTKIDFISKMHVNHDIPASVTISSITVLPSGKIDLLKGVIDEKQALVLGEDTWSAKMRVDTAPSGALKFSRL